MRSPPVFRRSRVSRAQVALVDAGMNPLVHFVRYGEGAVESPGAGVEPAGGRERISVPETGGIDDVLRQQTSADRAALESGAWWHTIDLGGGRVTAGIHSAEQLSRLYAGLDLPDDLSGKRLLDVGCWDGFYSFEAERHGAHVTAVDCFRPENFFTAHEALHSLVDFREMSVYELRRDTIGSFDVVLFLGVIYHLRHPLLGLERICDVTTDVALIESHVIGGCSRKPAMRFYEVDELAGQYDNWWGPDVDCLVRMARAAGFVDAVVLRVAEGRALIKASRNWHDWLSTEDRPSLEIRYRMPCRARRPSPRAAAKRSCPSAHKACASASRATTSASISAGSAPTPCSWATPSLRAACRLTPRYLPAWTRECYQYGLKPERSDRTRCTYSSSTAATGSAPSSRVMYSMPARCPAPCAQSICTSTT